LELLEWLTRELSPLLLLGRMKAVGRGGCCWCWGRGGREEEFCSGERKRWGNHHVGRSLVVERMVVNSTVIVVVVEGYGGVGEGRERERETTPIKIEGADFL